MPAASCDDAATDENDRLRRYLPRTPRRVPPPPVSSGVGVGMGSGRWCQPLPMAPLDGVGVDVGAGLGVGGSRPFTFEDSNVDVTNPRHSWPRDGHGVGSDLTGGMSVEQRSRAPATSTGPADLSCIRPVDGKHGQPGTTDLHIISSTCSKYPILSKKVTTRRRASQILISLCQQSLQQTTLFPDYIQPNQEIIMRKKLQMQIVY